MSEDEVSFEDYQFETTLHNKEYSTKKTPTYDFDK